MTEAMGIGSAATCAMSPAACTPGTLVRPIASTSTQPEGFSARPSCSANGARCVNVVRDEQPGDLLGRTVGEADRGPERAGAHAGHPVGADRHSGRQVGGELLAVGEHRDARRDRPDQPGQVAGPGRSQDADVPAGELVAVAERAVRHHRAEQRVEPGLVGQGVDHAGREHDTARPDHLVAERDDEAAAVRGHRGDRGVAHRHGVVRRQLLARGAPELGRRRAVVGDDVVHVRGRVVAVGTGVDHQHRPVHPAQGQGGLEAGRSPPITTDVVVVHLCSSARSVSLNLLSGTRM